MCCCLSLTFRTSKNVCFLSSERALGTSSSGGDWRPCVIAINRGHFLITTEILCGFTGGFRVKYCRRKFQLACHVKSDESDEASRLGRTQKFNEFFDCSFQHFRLCAQLIGCALDITGELARFLSVGRQAGDLVVDLSRPSRRFRGVC